MENYNPKKQEDYLARQLVQYQQHGRRHFLKTLTGQPGCGPNIGDDSGKNDIYVSDDGEITVIHRCVVCEGEERRGEIDDLSPSIPMWDGNFEGWDHTPYDTGKLRRRVEDALRKTASNGQLLRIADMLKVTI